MQPKLYIHKFGIHFYSLVFQYIISLSLKIGRNLAPALVVGSEGVWGVLAMSLFVLPLLWYIPGSDHGSYENIYDCYVQVKNSQMILYMGKHFFSLSNFQMCI